VKDDAADHTLTHSPDAAPSVDAAANSTVGPGRPTPADPADLPQFAPPEAPEELGRLGKYRILKELGRGGMGAVYLAFDERLQRRVALKVMLPKDASPTAKDRFLREARAAAQLSSDHVVSIFEADEIDGVTYIAQQFLQGAPLDEYLKKKGTPTLPQAVRIARETALGLAAAHKLGLVHRDIKPGNVWLEAPGGRVKVLDFGLAKPLDAAVELTRQGQILGTPAYMSPEQARAEAVDHRADLFSLGCMMYRLVTGRLPFDRPTVVAVLTAIATEEPTPVRELNPDVPGPLAELIHQLLAKTADARPPSADAVVARLRALSGGLQRSAATPRPSETAPLPLPMPDPPGEPPRRRPVTRRTRAGGRWVGLAVGGTAAALAVVGTVLFFTQDWSGTHGKVTTQRVARTPDTASAGFSRTSGLVSEPAKGPGTSVPPTTAVSEPRPADPDRAIARWVLSAGGVVEVSGVDDRIKDVADLPKGAFTLTAVSVAKTAVTDAELTRFQDCRGLTYFHMEGTSLSDAGMPAVAAFPALRELHMAHTGVTDTGLAHFAGPRRLTALDLTGTKVTNAGLAHFADCRQLAYLYLRDTAVSDAGLEHLAGCRGLVHITLCNTAVTDVGLAHLKECVGFHYVDLGGTKVSDVTLAQLEGCRDLTGLDVRGTGVTAKGVARLHAALPRCEIEHDGGPTGPKK
jgi:serine/threonine protein kinase